MNQYLYRYLYSFTCLCIVTAVFCLQGSQEDTTPEKPVKVLVLNIASDDLPVYGELQNIWRQYMHRYPEQIEAYFMKADPNMDTDIRIEGDVIWVKCEESLRPGILYKTLKALEYFLPRIKTEFTHVLRANLSSFFIFPRYLSFLNTCPRIGFYGGSDIGGGKLIGTGSGFTISRDVAALLVKNQKKLLKTTLPDDIAIALFLREKDIPLQLHIRKNFFSLEAWLNVNGFINPKTFHIRVKSRDAARRITDDVFIHNQLYKMFYDSQEPYKTRKHKKKGIC